MKSPTVSIIMATYNHADFVEKSIQSVLMQQGVDFEFLIGDDGSSDNTRDVVASICDERIRFFPNQENRGACTVTNELIQRATGEFIALINSDDYWIGQDKLTYQLQVLQENPTVGACFGRVRFIDKHDMPIPKTALPFGRVFDQENKSQGKWLRYFFDCGNCICHPTMLIRKECYDSVGMYDNRLRQLPDFDMWVRLVVHYPIYISDRELINFRIMPGENASSQTTTNSIRTINEHFLIAEKYFEEVNRDLLIDGFVDLLIHKNVPTAEHLNIEKTLLFFKYNEWLGKPYKMVGLLKLHSLFNDCTYRDILANNYGVDDRWFHQKTAEIDVLLPKAIIDMDMEIKHLNKILSEQKAHIENQVTHIENQVTHIENQVTHIENQATHIENQATQIENQATHISNLNHAITEKVIHIEDLLTHIGNIESELLNFQSSWYGKLRAIVQRQKQRYFIKKRNDT